MNFLKEKRIKLDNKFAEYKKENEKVKYYGTAHNKDGKSFLLLLDDSDYQSAGYKTVTRTTARKILTEKAKKENVVLDYIGFFK